MISRNDASPKASSSNKTPTHPYLWDNSTLIQSEGNDLLIYSLYTISKTLCCIKFTRRNR
jgi:hypothetical protein